jgi:hypothetical protein
MKLKKVKSMKGFVIAENVKPEEFEPRYQVFTQDEWSQGEGFRYAEFDDVSSIEEAIELVKNY